MVATIDDARFACEQTHTKLASQIGHLANLVAGPKREAWFNAELFVTLNECGPAFPSGQLAVYGEQSFRTVLRNAELGGGDLGDRDKPDLVAFHMSGDEPLAMVIEQKIVYSSDADAGESAIQELDRQLKNGARQLQVPALGVVYLVKAPQTWEPAARPMGVDPTRFIDDARNLILRLLPDADYDWAMEPALVGGNRTFTTMAYPACFFAIAMAARWLRAAPPRQ